MKEIWKDIKGFENYQVSNLGRIKRKGKIMFIKDDKQKRKYYKRYDELIMKQFKDNVGYYTVTLNCHRKRVHRLVAEAFLKKSKGKNVINHIDCNKLNNCVNNLEFCTYKENSIHASKNGLINLEPAIEKTSKKVDMFDLKNNYIRTFNSISEAKRYLGINRYCGSISEVCNGKRNKAKGYIWRYHE